MIYPSTNRHRSLGARAAEGGREGLYCLYGRPIGINRRKVHQSSVGAVERGMEGLYGRPWVGALSPTSWWLEGDPKAFGGRLFESHSLPVEAGVVGSGGGAPSGCLASSLARTAQHVGERAPKKPGLAGVLLLSLVLFLMVIFASCSSSGQQTKQPDPRLKSFHILSAHIIMLDSQAEVDGTVQNMGQNAFPFDVTIVAAFYDSSGHMIGQAQGVAEDVFPGMVRSFVLMGQVDSLRYSYMKLSPVSLRERRYEKNIPTPTPVVP